VLSRHNPRFDLVPPEYKPFTLLDCYQVRCRVSTGSLKNDLALDSILVKTRTCIFESKYSTDDASITVIEGRMSLHKDPV
jgi:hypothetical protein